MTVIKTDSLNANFPFFQGSISSLQKILVDLIYKSHIYV